MQNRTSIQAFLRRGVGGSHLGRPPGVVAPSVHVRRFCLAASALLFLLPLNAAADHPQIHFDVPPLVAATTRVDDQGTLVEVEVRLSSMIIAADLPRIDQWLVQCRPRGGFHTIADYSPRTELASDVAGPIQVKSSSEQSKSVGLSVDAAYGHLARLHSGMDRGSKEIDSVQLDRVAPVQVVTASGTVDRGRGVFFKLRWTAQQVLEGEKTFRLTFRAPDHWRGGLIDVSVIAQSRQKSFAAWDDDIATLGKASFVVAAYRENDRDAAVQARKLFDAENELRNAANQFIPSPSSNSLKALFRQVAAKLDTSDETDLRWIDRLIKHDVDPHFDKEIRKLPMQVRVAVLDYVESRDDFLAMNER